MSEKPPPLSSPSEDLHHEGLAGAKSIGADSNPECGCSVRLGLDVERVTGAIINAGFECIGCDLMKAAAELVCRELMTCSTNSLTFIARSGMLDGVFAELNQELPCKDGCRRALSRALDAALADHRMRCIEESVRSTPLICSCFGVEERAIIELISEGCESFEDISARCNAGSGCGSCIMVIDEILDSFGSG